MRWRIGAWFVCVIIVSVVAWYYIGSLRDTDTPIAELRDTVIRPAIQPVVGETIPVSIALKGLRNGVLVRNVVTSCGCTRITWPGKSSAARPFRLDRGREATWTAFIDTTGRFGENSFAVNFQCGVGDRQAVLPATIVLDINPGMSASPSTLILHLPKNQTVASGSVDVLQATRRYQRLDIGRIEVSHPGSVSVSHHREDYIPIRTGWDGRQVTHTVTVRISFSSAPNEDQYFWLRLFPAGRQAAPLEVPIRVSIPKPRLFATPQRVVVGLPAGANNKRTPIERIVAISFRDGAAVSDLKLSSSPGVSARIVKGTDKHKILIHLTIANPVPGVFSVTASTGDGECLVVPLRVIAIPANGDTCDSRPTEKRGSRYETK